MGSASAELGPVLGLDVESTGIGGTAEGHMWSEDPLESLLDQAAAAAHHKSSSSKPHDNKEEEDPQREGASSPPAPVSYSWALHLPLPLPIFYRLYGSSEGKTRLAKAKPRDPPSQGNPFDLLLGVTVRVREPEDACFPPLPPLQSSLVPAALTPCPLTAPHRASDSLLHPAFLHHLQHAHVLSVDLRSEEVGCEGLSACAPLTTSLLALHPMPQTREYDLILVPESCLTFSVLWGHLRHELWGAPSFNAFLLIGPSLLTKHMVPRTPPQLPQGVLGKQEDQQETQEVWGQLEPRSREHNTQQHPQDGEGEGEGAWSIDRQPTTHQQQTRHDTRHDGRERDLSRREERRERDERETRDQHVGRKRVREEEEGHHHQRERSPTSKSKKQARERDHDGQDDNPHGPLIRFGDSPDARQSCVFADQCIRHKSGRCPYRLHPGDAHYIHPSRVICRFGRTCAHHRKGVCKHVHFHDPLPDQEGSY